MHSKSDYLIQFHLWLQNELFYVKCPELGKEDMLFKITIFKVLFKAINYFNTFFWTKKD